MYFYSAAITSRQQNDAGPEEFRLPPGYEPLGPALRRPLIQVLVTQLQTGEFLLVPYQRTDQ
ncbi:hypothetical protein D3C74_490550 [compost metagenome]